MTANEEYALRIANGEKLAAILDEVRVQGYENGIKHEKARKAKSVRTQVQNV